jgi:hypothetical protein
MNFPFDKDDRYKQYLAYVNFLNRWLWDSFGTLSFPASGNFNPEYIKKIFKKWLRDLCIREHIQVACTFLIVNKGITTHIHFLLFSRCARRDGEIDRTWFLNEKDWEQYWPHRSRIDYVRSQLKARKYFARHLWKHRHNFVEIDFYNKKLLKKEKLDDYTLLLNSDFLNA